MGRVLLAHDRERGRTVAVKQLLSGAGIGDEARRRFGREARIMTLAEHPHLIQVLEFDTAADPPFLVMEAVEGASLLERTREAGPLPLAAAVRLVGELAGAVDALHARQILHRDIKPANVMLRAAGGAAVLMDLGLASYAEFTVLTHAGQLLGTPRYLPPEVVRGGEWSRRGDLYQLGTVAFEALTGLHMVQAASFDELPGVIAAGRWAAFPEGPGAVPGPVRAVVRRMTALEPPERFGSAGEFARALAGAAAGDAELPATGGKGTRGPPAGRAGSPTGPFDDGTSAEVPRAPGARGVLLALVVGFLLALGALWLAGAGS